ncbi:hypothetical protein OAO01_09170 [Oligoflexia bacterium]|nr:hypothetical protein [Oligoflexia bacterium]
MTVTIVKGLAGKTYQNNNQVNVLKASNKQASDGGKVARGAVTEAAHATLSSARGTPMTDKIREYKEAKKVSESVADRIKDDEKSPEAHDNLSPVTAREHFAG